MKIRCILFLVFTLMSTFSYTQVTVYDTFDDFEKEILLDRSIDTTYVVNFWATWCAPCVKELPYFEALNEKYKDGKFKQVLVTLDDKKKVDSRVIPFIEKKNILSEVVLLADGKANSWIDKVDPAWSGAIPITLFLKGNQKLFYEKEFHSIEELEKEMKLLK